ncbi:MAG: DEAD/DEAH box helicase, partial [Acidimicrobiales bacterium]
LGVPLPSNAPAVVMTPEKLAAHLRNEPERMRRDFSLFLIDEAHLLGDAERGWVLESALGFLHDATLSSPHRIILLSAAIGKRAHVSSWLSLDGVAAEAFHHDWRGPRRAHALFGTAPDWDKAEVAEPRRRGGLVRQLVPLHGTIHIRTAPGKHHSLRTTEPIGTLALTRRGVGEKWKRDSSKSDAAYRIRARMATVLAQQGSVLIVEPTKLGAQRTAIAIADLMDEDDPECAALVALATTRLGAAHPRSLRSLPRERPV